MSNNHCTKKVVIEFDDNISDFEISDRLIQILNTPGIKAAYKKDCGSCSTLEESSEKLQDCLNKTSGIENITDCKA